MNEQAKAKWKLLLGLVEKIFEDADLFFVLSARLIELGFSQDDCMEVTEVLQSISRDEFPDFVIPPEDLKDIPY